MTNTNTDILNWYEAGLPLHERKLRGHFSTPPRLVEHILDACGYTPENDLAHVRVLDPACGSGNFLAGAAHRLVSYAARQGLSRDALLALASRNLWGFDPDPVSCFLAEMQVKTVLDDDFPTSDIHLSQGIALHIHQADGLALPWQDYEGVDLFLANPPYLAAKNTDLSGYRSTHRQGQLDSYLLFLDLALSVVRPGGWLGLVLPDPMLARANAACVRAHLLQTCTLHHLWHLSGVFSAQVGAVVLVAQKCHAHSTHLVSWKRAHWQHEPGKHSEQSGEGEPRENAVNTVPQTLFQRQPGAELRYLLSREQGSLVERLREQLECTTISERRLAPLSDFLTLRRGEELGRKSSLLVWDVVNEEDYFPVLLGGVDVKPYGTPVGSCGIAREVIEKPLERYLTPKLLVVKSTDRLQAALDVQGHVVLQTLYVLHVRTDNHVGYEAELDDLYFFLALLNSRVLRDYVYVLHTAYKWVQPQMEQHVLARLPVPLVTQEARREIVERAKLLVQVCSEAGAVVELKQQWEGLYEEQERAIRALYASVLA